MSPARFWPALLLLSAVLSAQDGSPVRGEQHQVITNFRVAHDGGYLEGLQPQGIVVLEDGVPRNVTLFESRSAQSQTPVDLILLFDASQPAASWGLLNPGAFQQALFPAMNSVRIAVYSFGDTLNRLSLPTRDATELERAFGSLAHPGRSQADRIIPFTGEQSRHSAPGETSLYESIIAAARDVAGQSGGATRMMVVFSDGRASTAASAGDAAAVANELGMPVYPVAMGRRAGSVQAPATQDFFSLAQLTGGVSFESQVSPVFVRQLLTEITRQMRAEYVVGFDSTSTGETHRHQIEIRLVNEDAGKVVGGARAMIH